MEYKSTTGNIGFARNVGAFFPAAAHHVVEYLAKLLPAGWPLDIHRVIFMRTIGGVQPHRDEGGRRCCINIGIRDADTSITRTSRDDNFDTFDTNYDDFVVENGSAYLLDVSRVHAVIEKRPARRLLISYGFGVPFADMLAKINHATLQPVATRTDVP